MTPSGIEAYQLGRAYTVMPIPMVPEHCVEISAGPVTFVVEARALSDDAIIENEKSRGVSDGVDHDKGVDDYGASLHVCDADGRLGKEFLRFDAFDNEPHYHYIFNESQSNVVVRFDNVAEGDPLEWTLRGVGSRLAEMLEYAEGADVAAAVRANPRAVSAGLERLDEVLRDAHAKAYALRG